MSRDPVDPPSQCSSNRVFERNGGRFGSGKRVNANDSSDGGDADAGTIAPGAPPLRKAKVVLGMPLAALGGFCLNMRVEVRPRRL